MTRSTTALNSASSWRRILRKTAVAAIWLMVWYALYIIVKQEILIVSPVRVLTRLFELMGEGGFWLSMGTSLLRIAAGFLAAVAAGTVIAILSALSSFVRDLFLPVIRIVRAMPVASFIILALIWLNTGGVPVFTAFLMVFPVVWGNIYEGIRNTDHKLLLSQAQGVFAHLCPVGDAVFYCGVQQRHRPRVEGGYRGRGAGRAQKLHRHRAVQRKDIP